MNTESIKTFIMLSKLKNFTRTAERLYVAQSTVTNRIGELENETGKKLFVRRRDGVELTEEGELFLGYALRIAELEDSFIQQVNSSAKYALSPLDGAWNSGVCFIGRHAAFVYVAHMIVIPVALFLSAWVASLF